MGLLDRIRSLLRGSDKIKSNDPNAYWVYVQCQRCGEKLRGRVDLRNDLSPNYDGQDSSMTYFCRKVIIGEQICFQPIEVELTFDKQRKVIESRITGGKFISREAFLADEPENPA